MAFELIWKSALFYTPNCLQAKTQILNCRAKYRMQPCKLTDRESNDIKTHYWDQSWYDKSIFDDKDKAIAYLEDLGFTNIKVL